MHETKANEDWEVAAGALAALKANGYKLDGKDGLKKDALVSLVRALKVGKGTGNKPALAA